MTSSVICIGAAMIDELFFCQQKAIVATSNPASMQIAAGGVVGNISQHLGLLNIPVHFITAVGNDADGEWLEKLCKKRGVSTENFLKVDEPTGKYISILQPDGSLFTAACADISGKYLTPELLHHHEAILSTASFIICDTNITTETIGWLSKFCVQKNIKLIIEPVSVEKAKKISTIDLHGIYMLTPNEDELPSLCINSYKDSEHCIEELLQRGAKYVWLRKGKRGSELYSTNERLHLDTVDIQMIDSTGAGDAALAGWVASHLQGWSNRRSLQAAHTMAYEVLQVKGAIIETLTKNSFSQLIQKYYPDAQ